MNLWHDISVERIKPEDFLAVIEITKSTKTKYELDKESGALILDRVLYTAMRYPESYGFVPKTLGEDNDPLDVLVLASEPILPMSLVHCYPVGAIRMVDNSENDDKILAVPFGDPSFNHIKGIDAISPHLLDEYLHFFKEYKRLEKKSTRGLEVLSRERAVALIEESLARYVEKFGR